MCIRDRISGFFELVTIWRENKIMRNGIKNETNPKLSTKNAVSYTHLRAHETVLDLVCRLLLEKKKKAHDDENWYLCKESR